MTDPNTPDNILGQEFLTWLWFRSDTNPQAFTTKDGQPFSVSMEQRITVEGGAGQERETAAVSGAVSPLREARFGLATGKKVSRALLQIEKEEMTFQVTLKAEDFSLNSLRTPKVEQTKDPDEDPDAATLEKIFLLETAVQLLDRLYEIFLGLRLKPSAWSREVADMKVWTSRTE